MDFAVKVCGLSSLEAVRAAASGGAAMVGFVFYPRSPRSLTMERAAAVAGAVPPGIRRVGVVVDPSDDLLDELMAAVPLDALQLHGQESPARVAQVRARTGLEVIKALRIAGAADLEPVPAYAAVADRLLFDAKPPLEAGHLPGGNGLSFDWRLLDGLAPGRPWILSGGLNPENLEAAVRLTGAPAVDVSSGVEVRPGLKDPALITSFLAAAQRLGSGSAAAGHKALA